MLKACPKKELASTLFFQKSNDRNPNFTQIFYNMIALETPPNETQRIETLKGFGMLDTPPDGAFDSITQLASTIFDVPISIISLVDTDRIWFKSHHGLSVKQIGRDPGLCASAILSNEIYVVEDARNDPRTLANPLVASDFGLQFYAAVPLRTDEQHNLGTLCIIDKQPRHFTDKEKKILEQMGQLVMDEMHKRLHLRQTVQHIKNLASDLESELDDTIDEMETNQDVDKKRIMSYLDATRLFVSNIKGQLDL